MAYSKKSTTTATKKPESAVDEEKEMLKKQIEEMQAQMKMMADMIAAGGATEKPKSSAKKSEKQITFVNMTNGTLVLRGTNFYTIEGQFKTRDFPEREARLILNNSHNAIVQGCAYILDSEFIEENNLDIVYANLLSDKDLKGLFNKLPSQVIEIYKSVSDAQKNIIVSMIEEKQANGQFVDGNILLEISRLAGKDLINNQLEG